MLRMKACMPYTSLNQVGCHRRRSDKPACGVRQLLRAAAIIILAAIALALPLTQPAQAQDSGAGEYRLGIGDRLQVRVFGRDDLSGIFEVQAPGTIAFPLLGAIDVHRQTPAELEKTIGEKLNNDYQISASVSVEIAQYRPFYIVGDVMSPGKYPYAPGINVLQAVATAGGYYTFRPSAATAQMDAIRASEGYNVFTIQQRAALIRRARLIAEREGLDSVAVPNELLGVQGEPDIQAILSSERQLFTARKDGLNSEITLVQAQAESFQKEIGALKAVVAANVEQRRLLNLELQDAQKMLDKGLTQRPRVLELQRLVASLSAEESQARAFLARAEQNIGKIEEQVAERRSSYREEVEQQLTETEAQLLELAQHRAASRDMVAATAHGSMLSVDAENPPKRGKFVIRRTEGGETHEIEATELTPVFPDDVLEVPTLIADPAPSDTTAPAASGANTTN